MHEFRDAWDVMDVRIGEKKVLHSCYSIRSMLAVFTATGMLQWLRPCLPISWILWYSNEM